MPPGFGSLISRPGRVEDAVDVLNWDAGFHSELPSRGGPGFCGPRAMSIGTSVGSEWGLCRDTGGCSNRRLCSVRRTRLGVGLSE